MDERHVAHDLAHLVGLQVANHVKARAGHLGIRGDACKLADKLLGAVLAKGAISRLPGQVDLRHVNGLRDGEKLDLRRVAPGTSGGLGYALENLLPALDEKRRVALVLCFVHR